MKLEKNSGIPKEKSKKSLHLKSIWFIFIRVVRNSSSASLLFARTTGNLDGQEEVTCKSKAPTPPSVGVIGLRLFFCDGL